jgi:D-arginine dehydrogenase
LSRIGADWQVEVPGQTMRAPIIINAAGAWADVIAKMAGVATKGLRPLRRTALLVDPPAGMVPDAWPMVVDVEEQFYLKPDAGKLLISPADETPSEPCDAQPEELDIAICVDRIQTAFDLQIRRIDHKWAGLRSFLPDGDPVAGYAPDAPGFFWLAGQGGYGIQSAPAMARSAAALVQGLDLPGDVADLGVTAAALSPSRQQVAA